MDSRVSCTCRIDASIVGRTQAQGGSRVFLVAPLVKFGDFMLLCIELWLQCYIFSELGPLTIFCQLLHGIKHPLEGVFSCLSLDP